MSYQRVLFVCTHNSARSQMAEGLLRHLAGDHFEAFSAGTEATHVRPLAIRALDELGIDISQQQSKTLDRYLPEPFKPTQAAPLCLAARGVCIGHSPMRARRTAPKWSSLPSTARCATSCGR
jgi:predicted protein tyrosine phosphatase